MCTECNVQGHKEGYCNAPKLKSSSSSPQKNSSSNQIKILTTIKLLPV